MMIHVPSTALYLVLIVWLSCASGTNGSAIRQHPSASFVPSNMDRVIDLTSKKEDFDSDIRMRKKSDDRFWTNDPHDITSQERDELGSKLRSLFGPGDSDHNSAYIRKVLDLMFQDMERKSRPRYG